MKKSVPSRSLLVLVLLASVAAKCAACKNKATQQPLTLSLTLTLAHEVVYIEDGKTQVNLAIQSEDAQGQGLKYQCLNWTVQKAQGKLVNAAGHVIEPSYALSYGDNALYYEPRAGSAGKHILEVVVSDQAGTISKKQQIEMTVQDHREVAFQVQIKPKKTVFFLHEPVMLTLEISASQAGASSACYKLQEILATQGGKLSTTAQGEELAPGHELAYGQHTLYYKAAGQAGVHDIKLAISNHKGDVKTVTTSFKLIEATFDSSASLKQVPRGGNEVLEAIIKVGAANLAEDPWQLASWQVAGAVGKLQSASGEELSAQGVKLQPGENRFVLAVSEREALTDVPQLKLSIEQPDGVTKPATLDLSEPVFQGIKTQVSVLQEALKTALSKAIAGERFGQERLNRIISQLAVFRGNLAVLTGATALNRDQVEEVLVAVEDLMQAGQTTFALELQVAKPVAFLGEEIKLLLTIRAAQEGAHAATYKLQAINSTKGGKFMATGQGAELSAGHELAQGVNALYYNPGSQAGVHEIRLVVSDGKGRSQTATTSLQVLDVTFFSKAELVDNSKGGSQSLAVVIHVGATHTPSAIGKWQLASWQIAGGELGGLQDALGDSLSTTGVSLCAGVNSFPLALSPRAALSGVPQLTLAVRQPDGVEKSLVLDLSKQVWQGVQASIGTLKGDLATALKKVATGDRFGADQLGRVVEQLRGLRGNLDVLARSAAVAQAQVEAAIVQVDQLLQAAAVSAIDRAIRKKFGRGVEEKDLHGRVPLIEAIDQGDEAGVELVLKHPQVDLKAPYPIAHRKDMPPCPALHYAIIKRGDDTAIMQKLLEAGADMHARVFIEKAPLQLAPPTDIKTKTQCVVDGKCYSVDDPEYLRLQAQIDQERFTENIWSSKYMPPNQDYKGETALHIAAQEHSLASMKLLIARGADINAKNGYWQRPIHLVIDEDEQTSTAFVSYLLEQGADIDAIDLNGNTPLHYNVFLGNGNVALAKLLVEKGANLCLKNRACFKNKLGNSIDRAGWNPTLMGYSELCKGSHNKAARDKKQQVFNCLHQHTKEFDSCKIS